VVQNSRWSFTPQGEIDFSYSDLARNLGGCPDNLVGGRFNVLSILTTTTQLNFVNHICNVTGEAAVQSAPIELLLPAGIAGSSAVNGDLAAQISAHQYQLFYGRPPTAAEVSEAIQAGTECAQAVCTAEEFARPSCFALLSSAELLFY